MLLTRNTACFRAESVAESEQLKAWTALMTLVNGNFVWEMSISLFETHCL